MKRITWKKIVTRETTLLERYIRMIGYANGLGRLSNLKSKNILTVSNDGVSEQYFDELEISRSGKIALQEFKKSQQLFEGFRRILNDLIKFVKRSKQVKSDKKKFPILLKEFIKLYGYGRGIIYYGHFAEDVFSKLFEKELNNLQVENVKESFNKLTSPSENYGKFGKYFAVSSVSTKNHKKLLARLELSSTQKRLMAYLQKLGYYHEVAEAVCSESFSEFGKTLDKISRLTGIVLTDIKFYTPDEIYRLLGRGLKIYPSEIESRKKFFVLQMLNGQLKTYLGHQGKRIVEKELPKEKSVKTKQVSGVVACAGKIIMGRVRLVRKQADMAKMKKGDVLVSPMTTPRLMQAVRLASAIITDEGGITSHAAIVSRELGIPCIIGTKIATKVFKDGDLVEVDANKGIVRLVSSKKLENESRRVRKIKEW